MVHGVSRVRYDLATKQQQQPERLNAAWWGPDPSHFRGESWKRSHAVKDGSRTAPPRASPSVPRGWQESQRMPGLSHPGSYGTLFAKSL